MGDILETALGRGDPLTLLSGAILRRPHLLKKTPFMEDLDGHRYELRYIRDKEGREVDFALVKEGQVQELIEAKVAEKNVTRSLRYYAGRLEPKEATQVVANLRKPYSDGKISVIDPLSCFNEAFYR